MQERSNGTPFYLRFLCLLFSIPAILLGIPLGIEGAITIWRWMMDTVSADSNDGYRFLIGGGLLISAGMVGIRASLRAGNRQ